RRGPIFLYDLSVTRFVRKTSQQQLFAISLDPSPSPANSAIPSITGQVGHLTCINIRPRGLARIGRRCHDKGGTDDVSVRSSPGGACACSFRARSFGLPAPDRPARP